MPSLFMRVSLALSYAGSHLTSDFISGVLCVVCASPGIASQHWWHHRLRWSPPLWLYSTRSTVRAGLKGTSSATAARQRRLASHPAPTSGDQRRPAPTQPRVTTELRLIELVFRYLFSIYYSPWSSPACGRRARGPLGLSEASTVIQHKLCCRRSSPDGAVCT